jgi:hypothetical protein
VLGWLDDQTLALHSWDAGCGEKDIRMINVETGVEALLWEGYFRQAALDPASQTLAIGMAGDSATCNPEGEQGIFFMDIAAQSEVRILEDEPYEIRWSPEAGLFFSRTEFGMQAISTLGEWVQIGEYTGNLPAASVDKQLAWYGDEGLWVGALLSTIENEPQQVFAEPIVYALWSLDGEWVLFFGEAGFYAATAPDFAPVLISDGLTSRDAAWLLP